MPRNYTMTTIKTLFAEASACAYPSCGEPLIFHDRGKATVVADIAHIRSETPGGPRHDPDYAGDVDGPDNLLLLCNKHHRPVDRHEVVYTIAELEGWKTAQRASAGAGTRVTESDIRAFARLSADEQKIIYDIARLSERVTRACRDAQGGMEMVRGQAEQARLESAYRSPPLWEVSEDGTRRYLNDQLQLPGIEQQKWNAKVRSAHVQEIPRVRQALNDLAEEVAVLRMISGPLAGAADVILAAAQRVAEAVGDAAQLDTAVGVLDIATANLWKVANGQED